MREIQAVFVRVTADAVKHYDKTELAKERGFLA